MSKSPNLDTDVADRLGAILRHYREFADIAWSEVTDKVHTVEQYHKALDYLTATHTKELQDIVAQECIGAKIDGAREIMILVGRTSMHSDDYNALRTEADKYIASLTKSLERGED